MSAMPNPPSIAQYEQACLAGLAAAERQIRCTVDSFATKLDHSAEEIGALVNDLTGGLHRIRLYHPCASYLHGMGRPWTWQQLSRLVTDLQQAINIYQEMYLSKLQFIRNATHIQQRSQQDWLQAVQQTTQANQAAADNQFRQWTGFFTRSCASCGYSLGDLYYKLTICPSCGLLLRK